MQWFHDYFQLLVPRKRKKVKDISAQEYTDVTYGAGAEGDYENTTEVEFMRAGASSKSNPEYEIPGDIIVMSQNPERLYEEVKQPPVAEESDWIELNVCPAYGTAQRM